MFSFFFLFFPFFPLRIANSFSLQTESKRSFQLALCSNTPPSKPVFEGGVRSHGSLGWKLDLKFLDDLYSFVCFQKTLID